MDKEISSLLLKSNRTLGTRLVEAGLCRLDDIDEANQVFVERVRAGDIGKASLLRILIFEKQVIAEADLIDYTIENKAVGGICLESFQINYEIAGLVDPDILWATWTMPLDAVENHFFVATCYYLSDIARKYWEERLNASITWYVCSISDMEIFLERHTASVKAEGAEK